MLEELIALYAEQRCWAVVVEDSADVFYSPYTYAEAKAFVASESQNPALCGRTDFNIVLIAETISKEN